MSTAQYDETAPPLVEQIKKQPGFLLHVSYEDASGFVVAEVWETQEQHDTWFNENV
ncbi:MAG: antibiotic biosynthesis monooxygenase, partial [Gaiellaceae bacterium]